MKILKKLYRKIFQVKPIMQHKHNKINSLMLQKIKYELLDASKSSSNISYKIGKKLYSNFHIEFVFQLPRLFEKF